MPSKASIIVMLAFTLCQTQTSPAYSIPEPVWDKMFAAPYKSATDAQAAWQPIANLIAKQMEKLPANATQDEFYEEVVGKLGPNPFNNYPRVSVFSLAFQIKGGGKAALFPIIASLRPATGPQQTRNAMILVTQEGKRVVGQVITSGLLLKGGRFDMGSGYRQGNWLAIGGCDWNVRMDAGYGPPTGAFFQRRNGKWHAVASYRGDGMSGVAEALKGAGRPLLLTTWMTNKGKNFDIYHEASDHKFVEAWRLQGSRVQIGKRKEVLNDFWALDSFLGAVKAKNWKLARTFLTDANSFSDEDLALIAESKERIYAGQATAVDINRSGLMFSIKESETKVNSYLVAFKWVNGSTLIDFVRRY